MSSGASSLESSGHLPTDGEQSSEPRDVATTMQSPRQSRRAPVVDLQNYQEASNIACDTRSSTANQEQPSVVPLKSDPTTILEKKVREEIFAEFESPPNQGRNQQAHDEQQQNYDMMMSTRNFTSPPGIRSPRHLPTVQDSSTKSMQMVHHHGSKLHQRTPEGSPMSPPPSSSSSTRSPVPRSPTMPTATFTLQTSPPPAQQQSVWGSHSLPHHAQQHQLPIQSRQQQPPTAASQQIHHSDSSEWTEFTSAPYNIGQPETTVGPTSLMTPPTTLSEGFPSSYSTPALSTLASSVIGGGGGMAIGHHQPQQRTDLSEFDPIHSNTASGSGGASNELHHIQPPYKHRT